MASQLIVAREPVRLHAVIEQNQGPKVLLSTQDREGPCPYGQAADIDLIRKKRVLARGLQRLGRLSSADRVAYFCHLEGGKADWRNCFR